MIGHRCFMLIEFSNFKTFIRMTLHACDEEYLYLSVLVGQSLSALSTTSLKNVSAVCCSHSFSKAVFLFSLTLFGLVCSEHLMHLLEFFRKRLAYSTFEAVLRFLYNDILYYTIKQACLSRIFLKIFASKLQYPPNFRKNVPSSPKYHLFKLADRPDNKRRPLVL